VAVAVTVAMTANAAMHHPAAGTWTRPTAFGASGTPLVSPSPSPSPRATASPRQSPVPHRTTAPPPAGVDAPNGGHLAVAVLDRKTGRQMVANGSERFHTASIVKVDILATLLWQDQRAGRSMTAAQKQTAVKMITVSDNDAADKLWSTIGGGPALATANVAFGLKHTTPGTTTAHPWGQTLTTATDQLRLLEVITETGGPLTAASQNYILSLMAKVHSGQRWGIPAAARHSTAVYVKDGWLAQSSDSWRWITNSIGRIVEPGHDFLVVTLSDHRSTESSGINAIERNATAAVSQLRAAG
jgi:beta-lactamase class A